MCARPLFHQPAPSCISRGAQCASVPADDRESLRYSYQASSPAHCDIHFHAGGKTQYPVYRPGVHAGSGVFTARQPNEFCAYWAHRGEGSVDLTFELRAPRR